MASLNRYRAMTTAEVNRIHAGNALIEREARSPAEIVADLICYCGGSWPKVIEEALRIANTARQECAD